MDGLDGDQAHEGPSLMILLVTTEQDSDANRGAFGIHIAQEY
jgi:hypothetical protein